MEISKSSQNTEKSVDKFFDNLNSSFHGNLNSIALVEAKQRFCHTSTLLESTLFASTQEKPTSKSLTGTTMDNNVWDLLIEQLNCELLVLEGGLSAERWELLIHGWLPQLCELCLVMEQLSAVERGMGMREILDNGQRAPLDIISLKMVCIVHCGLEFIVHWGINCRLHMEYGSLSRRVSKPLGSTVSNLLKPGEGSIDVESSPLFALSPLTGTGETVECATEPESIRELRICICLVILEKCLNIPQIRTLLLPRYYPQMIIALLGIIDSSCDRIRRWASCNLERLFRPTSVQSEVVTECGSDLMSPGGFSLLVKSLREISSKCRGTVGAEIGGLLSAVVCMQGGLEAVLDSFVGPINASQAAEEGSVEAVEALAKHLSTPPTRIDHRISLASDPQSITEEYISCVCPQLGKLFGRSLFVYGLGSISFSDSMLPNRPPPQDALPGLMSHMVLRLIGRMAETVVEHPKWSELFLKHVIFPFVEPLCLAMLTPSDRVSDSYSAPHEIHRSLVSIHALTVLVSPTPALIQLLTATSKATILYPEPCAFRSFCRMGIVPSLLRILCFYSLHKRFVWSGESMQLEVSNSTRAHASASTLLRLMSSIDSARVILKTLRYISTGPMFSFMRLNEQMLIESDLEAAKHNCLNDGIAIQMVQQNSHELTELYQEIEQISNIQLEGAVDFCYDLVLDVDSARNKSDEFVMVALFELVLFEFLNNQSVSVVQRRIDVILFSKISSCSDPLQLLTSTRAGVGVLRTLVSFVPSLKTAFEAGSDSPINSSRTIILTLVLQILFTLVTLGSPVNVDDISKEREGILKSLVVPLGMLSLTLLEAGRTGHTDSMDSILGEETDEIDVYSIKELAEKCQELHLLLIRHCEGTDMPINIATSKFDRILLSIDDHVMKVLQSVQQDLTSMSAPVRARGVFDLSSELKRLTLESNHVLIQDADSPIESLLTDHTFGYMLGVLLGMLADRESYVFLGAVHSIRCLTDIPPQANRVRHLQALVSCFAQVPLGGKSASIVATAARQSMEPLIEFHLTQCSQEDSTRTMLEVLERLKYDESSIIPLSFSQRTILGEALVLTVRWCGNATAHHASMLLPALIKGASPPLKTVSAMDRCALAAFRASCFSSIAEISNHLGWAINRFATDIVELCCTCLRLERGAVEDLKDSESPLYHHSLEARRGAAFLGMKITESCGYHLLQSGDSRTLQQLHQLFLNIHNGPGVARAHKKSHEKLVEWSLELDPVIRSHVAHGLDAIDGLLLQGTSGLASYVLPT